jgi:hypothetical protein
VNAERADAGPRYAATPTASHKDPAIGVVLGLPIGVITARKIVRALS